MRQRKYRDGIVAGLVLLSCASLAWSGNDAFKGPKKIFRYKDANGIQVTTYVLPPEAAGNGYEVINDKGDVLEVVKPAPTAAEKPAALAAIEQEKFDKNLLLQYGNLTELEQAQKRKLEELDSKMAVLQGNFSNIRSQIDAEQMKAANFERQGRPVPEESLKTLEALYANYETTETVMHEREKEIEDAKKQFAYELDRYKTIKGIK